MKRTNQRERDARGRDVKGPKLMGDVALAQVAGGDAYIHNPRGSNNDGNG